MNTKNLKAYAPKARSQFIEAIKKRAAQFGLYEDKIADIQFEGSTAIIEGRAFTKKQGDQRKRLEQKIDEKPLTTHKERFDLFIREISYTWFNRLAAIRYMELHDYFDHGFRVLSPAPNKTIDVQGSTNVAADRMSGATPEILDNASDVADSLGLDKSHIIELQLAGDKEEELYRALLLGQCHHLYKIMPFMFEKLDDASELLLPDNLTKTDSILKGLVNDIPEEDWSEIEVIGWLYQFYISEHKDAVIGKVVKSEDIPAATQLFTPNWIVKYLVQNSLGRQWLATYPESELKGKMEYYIEPAQQSDDVIEQLKAITPTSIDPEQIKVLDPAAGSGHILVEVYEVLREIYLERGYRLREIPELILTKNIYGLDIDDRAAQLAGFALMMKAREDDRRIFERMSQRVEDGEVTLNVYSLQSTENLDIDKLWHALDLEDKHQKGSTGGLFDGLDDEFDHRDKFEHQIQEGSIERSIPAQAGIYSQYYTLLQTLKTSFLQAKTLGSLIHIDNAHLQNLIALKELLQAKEKGSDPSAKQAAIYLLPIVNQAVSLAQQYDAVVANPPYMGGKGMNTELKNFSKKEFPNSKSDLFAMFMERSFGLLNDSGYNAQVNMQSWMFLSSYESLREWLLNTKTFVTMAHLGARAFGQISGEVVQTTAWILNRSHIGGYQPVFFRLIDGNEDEKREALINKEKRFDQTQQDDFMRVPGSPIAYWISNKLRDSFESEGRINSVGKCLTGLQTGNTDLFLRYWHEVSSNNIGFNLNKVDAIDSNYKWFPCSKGGQFRRWYGNLEYVVNWYKDGKQVKAKKEADLVSGKITANNSKCWNQGSYFEKGISWTLISSGSLSFRFNPTGVIFDISSPTLFLAPSMEQEYEYVLGYLNSPLSSMLATTLSPTLNCSPGIVSSFPLPQLQNKEEVIYYVKNAIDIAKKDWNSFETSYEFVSECRNSNRIIEQFDYEFKKFECFSQKLKEIEKKLNDLFLNYFDSDESQLNVEPLSSLKRDYGAFDDESRNKQFYSIRVIENISFITGCMMGRYSLDREGLVYAHSGNKGFKELVAEDAYQTFPADDDGIVPLASEDWLFEDDATARFREFVKTVWGDEHLQENLEFVAESLCLHALKPVKGESATDTVRRYFSKQFYKDHCKTYKKRPIYWLFSSGKEKAFECLVYLHRYNEGTLARMRTEYVTPLMGKYEQQQSMLSEQIIEASNTEQRQIEKDLKSLEKKQAELRTFDEQLKHYAEMRITLDLDDGVKANYGKFGNLLADVKGIHGKAVK